MLATSISKVFILQDSFAITRVTEQRPTTASWQKCPPLFYAAPLPHQRKRHALIVYLFELQELHFTSRAKGGRCRCCCCAALPGKLSILLRKAFRQSRPSGSKAHHAKGNNGNGKRRRRLVV